VVTHRYHAGRELVIEERLRLVDEAQLMYSHQVTGPDGTIETARDYVQRRLVRKSGCAVIPPRSVKRAEVMEWRRDRDSNPG